MDEEALRYRKRSVKKPPKKADHKHYYEPCVYGMNESRYTPARGFYLVPGSSIGTYCPVCGKIGELWSCDPRWRTEPVRFFTNGDAWTEEARREFNPFTRTLPYFWIDDYFQKFVPPFENRK